MHAQVAHGMGDVQREVRELLDTPRPIATPPLPALQAHGRPPAPRQARRLDMQARTRSRLVTTRRRQRRVRRRKAMAPSGAPWSLARSAQQHLQLRRRSSLAAAAPASRAA